MGKHNCVDCVFYDDAQFIYSSPEEFPVYCHRLFGLFREDMGEDCPYYFSRHEAMDVIVSIQDKRTKNGK